MSQVTLVFNRICPFAQRAWLVLLEKNVPFQKKQVSLQDKQPWFTQTYLKAYGADLTSNGKVPVLIHGDTIITESDLISWYVAQSFQTGSNLIPHKPFDRLRMRRFIQQIPGKLISAFYSTKGYANKSQADKAAVVGKINDSLRIIQKQIVGPFALGEQFSLADIMLYPWFERWCVNEKLFGITIPQEFIKIRSFIKAVQSRPSVKETMGEVSDQFYISGYEEYLK